MKEFKNKIGKSFFYLILKLVLICVLISPLILYTKFKEHILELNSYEWSIIGIISVLFLYFYIGLTSYDIKLTENEIEFKRRIFPFRKVVNIKLSEISEITLKHEWSETVLKEFKPKFLKYIIVEWILKTFRNEEYKWVKIKVNEKTHTFYCFGIEYECYDNPKPHFEDLYYELMNLDLKVNWTDNNKFYKEIYKRNNEKPVANNV